MSWRKLTEFDGCLSRFDPKTSRTAIIYLLICTVDSTSEEKKQDTFNTL